MSNANPSIFTAFLEAIPNAAKSPLAFAAYAAVVCAWTAIAWRVRRHAILLKNIQSLPEADRLTALRMEMGFIDVPKGLSADQFLRSRVHWYLFAAAMALIGVLFIVFAMSIYNAGTVSGSLGALG